MTDWNNLHDDECQHFTAFYDDADADKESINGGDDNDDNVDG